MWWIGGLTTKDVLEVFKVVNVGGSVLGVQLSARALYRPSHGSRSAAKHANSMNLRNKKQYCKIIAEHINKTNL